MLEPSYRLRYKSSHMPPHEVVHQTFAEGLLPSIPRLAKDYSGWIILWVVHVLKTRW